MKRVCAHCQSENIEAGEAGARDHCADCGGTRFVASLPPTPTPVPPTPASRAWFDAMHAAVEREFEASHKK